MNHGQEYEYFTTTGLVHCEIITEEAKMEEKLFVDISEGLYAIISDAKMISTYITYCKCLSFNFKSSPSFNLMDLNGNNILRVSPYDPSNIHLENTFFQSGKLMFIEGKSYQGNRYSTIKLDKLHVFDINSVMEKYEKDGELMCSLSDHESQTSFKSRSVCLKDTDQANISYSDDVTIITDKVSVSLYVSSRADLFARKLKLSFWNE